MPMRRRLCAPNPPNNGNHDVDLPQAEAKEIEEERKKYVLPKAHAGNFSVPLHIAWHGTARHFPMALPCSQRVNIIYIYI